MRPRPARTPRSWLPALALVACTERQVTPGPAPVPVAPASVPASAAAPAPTPTAPASTPPIAAVPELPAHRACGEAGDAPTELPPRLVAGAASVGRATLRPGDEQALGTVKLRYDRSAWVGTTRAGFHAPALYAEIDRAEAGGGPWGHQHQLQPGQVTHFFVGPYRFDVRVGAGDPPAELEVSLAREACRAAAVIEPSTDARWLWLSTEGIRQHTYDLSGVLLQFAVDAHGDRPRLDVSRLDYRHWFEPRPGSPRTILAGAHRITLDRVVPGPGARFTDRWQADGEVRLHARLAIEPLRPAPPSPPVAPTTACGDPGPARTTLPAALATSPVPGDRFTLAPGRKLSLGPLTLEHGTLEIPAHGGGPYRVEARQIPHVQILGDPDSVRGLPGPFTAPQLVRAGRALLRLEPVPSGALKIRRVPLACPLKHAIPPPTDPTYLWLSTIGVARVEVGAPGALVLQIHEDLREPSLAVTATDTYFSRRIAPDLAGLAFSFGDHVVEIVDVVDARPAHPDAPVPAVHVQLRVSATR